MVRARGVSPWRDKWFESISLQRRVHYELGPVGPTLTTSPGCSLRSFRSSSSRDARLRSRAASRLNVPSSAAFMQIGSIMRITCRQLHRAAERVEPGIR